jgi:hypothetical protein
MSMTPLVAQLLQPPAAGAAPGQQMPPAAQQQQQRTENHGQPLQADPQADVAASSPDSHFSEDIARLLLSLIAGAPWDEGWEHKDVASQPNQNISLHAT